MKQYSEACRRNEQPIAEVLREILPEQGLVLEVGSGTGQHAAAFSRSFPKLLWQPTNQPGHLDSIEAWREEVALPNFKSPQPFDLFDAQGPVPEADAIVAINVLHIAPWAATERLFFHADKLLKSDAPIFIYGPFRYRDQPLEESNQRFDAFLQRRDPQSGLRYFDEVSNQAQEYGFRHCGTRRLPANNDAHWWRKNG